MFGAVGAIKTIQSGGTAKVSRAQIVGVFVDLRKVTQGLDTETRLKVMDWYQRYRKDKVKEPYDMRKLDETVSSMDLELQEITGVRKKKEAPLEEALDEDAMFRDDDEPGSDEEQDAEDDSEETDDPDAEREESGR
ncbi:MAG: hypothetical protein ACOYJJ_04120 [Anaerovoracaceae bacterium]|jgi:hypothetical protein